MPEGFGRSERELRAERSLAKSTRELRQIQEVLKKYPNDPKGRKKMLKKLQKYWRSPLGELERINYTPGKEEFIPVLEHRPAPDPDPEDEERTISEEDKQIMMDHLRKTRK
jgi:hypothetical protein|tara:strand:+ start:77 stop:409 length:333 start_codon:yes stop_codon:yes gene_type:complete